MNFFNKYNKNIVKYDLIEKFLYKNYMELPQIEKIILNIDIKNFNMKKIVSSLFALKLISKKKGTTINSKKPCILLKIKKGDIIGCRVILINSQIDYFISKQVLQSMFTIKRLNINEHTNKSLNFTVDTLFFFNEIEQYFSFFENLSSLKVTLIINNLNYKEIFFILKSAKFITNTSSIIFTKK